MGEERRGEEHDGSYHTVIQLFDSGLQTNHMQRMADLLTQTPSYSHISYKRQKYKRKQDTYILTPDCDWWREREKTGRQSWTIMKTDKTNGCGKHLNMH